MAVHRSAPLPTDHAPEQWAERGDPSIGVRDAWMDAVPLERVAEKLGVDAARYHAATDTILIRRGERVVTVLERDGQRPDVWAMVDRYCEVQP